MCLVCKLFMILCATLIYPKLCGWKIVKNLKYITKFKTWKFLFLASEKDFSHDTKDGYQFHVSEWHGYADSISATFSSPNFTQHKKLNAKCKLKQTLTYEQEKHNQNTNKYKHKIVGMQHKCHRCYGQTFYPI